MFYRTQIKSVTTYGAIDMAGRPLSFIGYLPVKAGDWVYTDGRVIFGNVPPKGSAVTFSEVSSGVPILGNEELRGYFSKSGRFKKYSIAQDDWIVNSDEKFAHGADTFNDAKIIDADFSEKGELYTVEKKVIEIAEDSDFHYGYYKKESTTQYASMNFGRIAVVLPNDDFSDLEGFKYNDWYGQYRPFYMLTSSRASCSYKEGYYHAFEGSNSGYGIFMCSCYFLLPSNTLDFSKADGQILKHCELIIKKDDDEDETVSIANLLKDFEDAVNSEVDLLGDRKSVKHTKTRAIVHNFKILPDGSWEILIEAEFWASNTFYNENYTDDPTFHISSTVFHNHRLLKFTSKNTVEELYSWKFRYPLRLRDSYPANASTSSVRVEGAWVIRTVVAESGYSEIWHDYDSSREANSLEYDTAIKDFTENFTFPVQDDYHAVYSSSEDIGKILWTLDGIYNGDKKQIISSIFPDDPQNLSLIWNMSLVKLKNGGYLFGIRKDTEHEINGVLYKIDKDGKESIIGDGLKNFRLKELKKISKAKR